MIMVPGCRRGAGGAMCCGIGRLFRLQAPHATRCYGCHVDVAEGGRERLWRPGEVLRLGGADASCECPQGIGCMHDALHGSSYVYT